MVWFNITLEYSSFSESIECLIFQKWNRELVCPTLVVFTKRHQQLDKILIIFTRTIQKISKVVCKKTLSETCAFITSLCCMKGMHYSKHMLHKQDCIKIRMRIARQSFFLNNFVDFSNVVRVKKNLDFGQPLVAFPISNISYCLFIGTQVNLGLIWDPSWCFLHSHYNRDSS